MGACGRLRDTHGCTAHALLTRHKYIVIMHRPVSFPAFSPLNMAWLPPKINKSRELPPFSSLSRPWVKSSTAASIFCCSMRAARQGLGRGGNGRSKP